MKTRTRLASAGRERMRWWWWNGGEKGRTRYVRRREAVAERGMSDWSVVRSMRASVLPHISSQSSSSHDLQQCCGQTTHCTPGRTPVFLAATLSHEPRAWHSSRSAKLIQPTTCPYRVPLTSYKSTAMIALFVLES